MTTSHCDVPDPNSPVRQRFTTRPTSDVVGSTSLTAASTRFAAVTEALGCVGAEVVIVGAIVKSRPDELDATGTEVKTFVTVAGGFLEPSGNRHACMQYTHK